MARKHRNWEETKTYRKKKRWKLGDRQTWIALTEDFNRRGTLCVADLLIPLAKIVRLEALPGQATTEEVEEHVTQSL